MSIAQFSLAERSIADTTIHSGSGKTPRERQTIALKDRAMAPEVR